MQEAERFKGEDDKMRSRIEAKNSLESTTYHVKNTLNDEQFKDKFSAEEKQTLSTLVEETQKWLDSHQEEDTEEYKNKLKELEGKFHPIMQRIYAQVGGAGAGAG